MERANMTPFVETKGLGLNLEKQIQKLSALWLENLTLTSTAFNVVKNLKGLDAADIM